MSEFVFILRFSGEIIETIPDGIVIWDEENKCYARIVDYPREFPNEGRVLVSIEYKKEPEENCKQITTVVGRTIYFRNLDKDNLFEKILLNITEWEKNAGYISHDLLRKSPFEGGDYVLIRVGEQENGGVRLKGR